MGGQRDTSLQLYTPTDEELQALRALEVSILREVDALCRRHDIPYSLGCGTLLGAIRFRGFIPWDDDVDICIPREDFQRFRAVCAAELDDRFFYQSHETEPGYCYMFDKIRVNNTVMGELFFQGLDIHQGVYLDIFPVDRVPDGAWRRLMQRRTLAFWGELLTWRFLDPESWTGAKRVIVKICRVLSAPFSTEFLYKRALRVMTRYAGDDTRCMSMLISDKRGREAFPCEYWYDRVETAFEDGQFPVPRAYDEMLRAKFGDYTVLPPEERRHTRHKITALELGGRETTEQSGDTHE